VRGIRRRRAVDDALAVRVGEAFDLVRAALPSSTTPPQSPGVGAALFDVNTIGFAAVPAATSLASLVMVNALPFSPLTVAPGSIVSVPPTRNT